MRRLGRILCLGVLWLVAGLTMAVDFTSRGGDMVEVFAQLAAQYEYDLFQHFPELGLFWGRLDVPLDRFSDYSYEGYLAWNAKEDDYLAQLEALDEQQLQGSPQYVTYQLLKQSLHNKKEARICKEELWEINPTFGWHNKLAIVAQKQPVGTPELRDLALTRWQTFPKVVSQQINNLKQGIQLRFLAPRPAVERVLTQIKIMANVPATESPYYDFARRDGDAVFRDKVEKLIEEQVNPALQHYIAFLEEEYLPQAKKEIGVSSLPAGKACYAVKIKQETTLNLNPEEIHALGLQLMQQLAEQIGEIGLKKYRTRDVAEVFRLAKQEVQGYFASEEDILNYNLKALARAQEKASLWFDMMPKTPGIIRPYPEHRAKTGASGEYHPPSDDGAEPGIFYINTFEPEKASRIDQEATLFHELIPGHHFQIALQHEDTQIPHLNRYLWNAGYGEGWALYVERLADEMGLYSDEISRLGMLSNESLRAARLVVDTGIHALGWTRQQAIDYLQQHTALNSRIIEGEVDRYIMMPGQATSYMLGKLEIESLRRLAQEKIGASFDIRQFHNQVLKNGVLPLPLLRKQIEQWIDAATANKKGTT